jgi:hypothetical protein
MAFNETIIILKSSVIASNLSQNLTTFVLVQNPNCSSLPDNSAVFSQIFPIITLIVGAFLTFFFNILLTKLKEKKEIRRYEYVLIDDILDIRKEDDAIDKMVNFFNAKKKDYQFEKIENYCEIITFLQSSIRGESPDPSNLIKIRDNLLRKI